MAPKKLIADIRTDDFCYRVYHQPESLPNYSVSIREGFKGRFEWILSCSLANCMLQISDWIEKDRFTSDIKEGICILRGNQ